jgi:hypothetical protein
MRPPCACGPPCGPMDIDSWTHGGPFHALSAATSHHAGCWGCAVCHRWWMHAQGAGGPDHSQACVLPTPPPSLLLLPDARLPLGHDHHLPPPSMRPDVPLAAPMLWITWPCRPCASQPTAPLPWLQHPTADQSTSLGTRRTGSRALSKPRVATECVAASAEPATPSLLRRPESWMHGMTIAHPILPHAASNWLVRRDHAHPRYSSGRPSRLSLESMATRR